MEEKKIPKEIRMDTCCMSKHIQHRRPVPSPHKPPTHPPNVQQWKAFTYKEEFLRETFQEGWDFARRTFCEKGILRERNFERRTFFEKGIFRERDFSRKGFWEKNPIDWFSKSLNKNWSIREWSDWPNSPSQKTIYFSSSDLISCAYVRARAQISRICKFGRVLRYVHCTDWYKIYLLKKIRCILSKFYNK